MGVIPRIENKMTPGTKKSLNGEFFNIDKGIPSSLPVGETINAPPPPIAPNPRNANKIRRIFRVVFIFITISSLFVFVSLC